MCKIYVGKEVQDSFYKIKCKIGDREMDNQQIHVIGSLTSIWASTLAGTCTYQGSTCKWTSGAAPWYQILAGGRGSYRGDFTCAWNDGDWGDITEREVEYGLSN